MDRRHYGWDDLTWNRLLLMPGTRGTRVLPWNFWWKRRKKVSRYIHDDQTYCRISMPANKGKITDAGYDELSCICAKVSAGYDFIVEADITIHHFLEEPGPNNQEGFGLFLRETVKRHRAVGLYYSNMAAVGGYYGRFNFFGRGGLKEQDISRIGNFVLYQRVNDPKGVFEHDPLHYRITERQPLRVHLCLRKQGRKISVRMEGMDGADLLAPEVNGGTSELSGTVFQADDADHYAANIEDAFLPCAGKSFYVGFFSARGAEIEIHKESFRLTVTGEAAAMPPTGTLRPAAEEDAFPKERFDPQDFASESKEIIYVSPEGEPSGDGSRERPLDITTAIARCDYNGQIVLQSGRYALSEAVVIGREHSGKPGRTKRMTGRANGGTVLDFGGTDGSLLVAGDYWLIENICVTNGFGIRIEGSRNWIRSCGAYRNYETGFLIRHHDNDSDRCDWPCHNVIEDCLSYENRDVAESNADGFACKVASGIGNSFLHCLAFLNADDGFDLFSKNRAVGAVTLRHCRSFLNGYRISREGCLEKSGGNGNGFKLGGSGLRVEHVVSHCAAEGNRQYGFTNNSNPYMLLEECRSVNNGQENIHYDVYEGSRIKRLYRVRGCVAFSEKKYRPEFLLDRIMQELSTAEITSNDRNG